MLRPNREKRDQKRQASVAAPATAPIDVRVPAGAGEGSAWIGGVAIVAADGEEIQDAVLSQLHRIALAAGHGVRATVRDERIGFVVPIQVSVDGSSELAGEPVRVALPEEPRFTAPTARPGHSRAEAGPGREPARPSRHRPTQAPGAAQEREPAAGTTTPTFPPRAVPEPEEAAPHAERPAPLQAPRPAFAQHDPAARQPVTPFVAPAPEDGTPACAGDTAAMFVLRADAEQTPLTVATPSGPEQGSSQTHSPAPGTVSAPTGVFGPPPVMTIASAAPVQTPVWAAPASGPGEPVTLEPDFDSDAEPDHAPEPDAEPVAYAAPEWPPIPAPRAAPVGVAEEEAKEPPVREFDSVAEAVLAPESGAVPPGGAGGPVAEPMARISAAVNQGRIEEAAGLAERAVAEASASLGADHSDVLRLRELTAYIAYLAGDPLRSFHLSLDLARLRHRLSDPRGAYGNVQSAAAAWRAVRDPVQGLHLGRDLITVWTELAGGEGPAAGDLDQLEKARNRMGRLAERARTATGTR